MPPPGRNQIARPVGCALPNVTACVEKATIGWSVPYPALSDRRDDQRASKRSGRYVSPVSCVERVASESVRHRPACARPLLRERETLASGVTYVDHGVKVVTAIDCRVEFVDVDAVLRHRREQRPGRTTVL